MFVSTKPISLISHINMRNVSTPCQKRRRTLLTADGEIDIKGSYHHFACLSLIYSIFIHIRLLTIISQRIKPYFSFPDILQNLLIIQNQIFKQYTHLKNQCFTSNSYVAL
ncbi:hypothetical protein LDENG_00134970 [Lucifuga dentata]|nr:hypothetical protein LDENG_00134970 [Lucifuga dentata]